MMAPRVTLIATALTRRTGLTRPPATAMPPMASTRSPGAKGNGTPVSSMNISTQIATTNVVPSRPWNQAMGFTRLFSVLLSGHEWVASHRQRRSSLHVPAWLDPQDGKDAAGSADHGWAQEGEASYRSARRGSRAGRLGGHWVGRRRRRPSKLVAEHGGESERDGPGERPRHQGPNAGNHEPGGIRAGLEHGGHHHEGLRQLPQEDVAQDPPRLAPPRLTFPYFFLDFVLSFAGSARDHESAVTIQARVASGFFCQPAGTIT